MWVYIYLLVLLIILGVCNGSLEDGACCVNGSVLMKRKPGIDDVPYCWDQASNTTNWTHLKCNKTVIIKNQFSVEEGTLWIYLAYDSIRNFEPGSFCVGDLLNRRNRTIKPRVLIVCTDLDEEPAISDFYKSIAGIISALFLTATAIIYAGLPELRDLMGKSIVNLCISMAIGLVLMAVLNMAEYSDMDLCAVRGFLTYFFLMVGFFWMNAISVQILVSTRRPTVNNYDWKTFGWYALYAWGCPAVLTIIMIIANYVPAGQQRPGFGLNTCWFYNSKLQWQYMYSVMTILFLANICIFIYTSVLLWKQRFSSDQTKVMRFKITFTIRLFIIMGVFWVFEMIESAAPTHIIWEILNLLNLIQGFFIFLILVVFRKRVLKAMHKRGWCCCVSGLVERWLAVGDDEENVVQHTIGVSMDDAYKN